LVPAKNHYGDFTTRKILLIADVLVDRQKYVEPRIFRRNQQLAIPEPVPALLRRGADCVPLQIRTQRHWRCLVEEDPHLRRVNGCFVKTASRKLNNGLD
jgi:hypothetical protein